MSTHFLLPIEFFFQTRTIEKLRKRPSIHLRSQLKIPVNLENLRVNVTIKEKISVISYLKKKKKFIFVTKNIENSIV